MSSKEPVTSDYLYGDWMDYKKDMKDKKKRKNRRKGGGL